MSNYSRMILLPCPAEYIRPYTDISGFVRDRHEDLLEQIYTQAFPDPGEQLISMPFFGTWDLSVSHHRRWLVEGGVPAWETPHVEEDRDHWFVRARFWKRMTGCLTNHVPNLEPLFYADLESKPFHEADEYEYEVFVQSSYLDTTQGKALSDELILWKLSQPVDPED